MTDFKGSILELKGNHAVVMTDVCDFVLVKRQPGMFVSQQVKFQKSDIYIPRKRYVKYIALAASVLFLVFSYAFYYQFFAPSTIYAYIDVDINHSMEFAIDKNAQVLNIKPLNKDAQIFLKNLKLVGLPVKQAITEVVNESKQLGFLKPNKKNAVLISASINAAKGYKPDKSGEKVLDSILTDIDSITFDLGTEKIKPKILKVTTEYRNLAIKNEISMGRYVLYNKLREEGINITVEEAKSARVSDMLDKTHIDSINDFAPETKYNVNQDNFKSNGDEAQVNKTEGNNNAGTSSQNADGKISENKNNYTSENKKNMDQGTNVDPKNSNNGNSNTATSEDINGNTGQGTTKNQNNKAGDSSDSSATQDKNRNTD